MGGMAATAYYRNILLNHRLRHKHTRWHAACNTEVAESGRLPYLDRYAASEPKNWNITTRLAVCK